MSYKPYPKYKDSGVDWIGEIPEGWQTVPMKYQAYMKGRIGWQGLKHEEFIDEGPFLITGMNFKNGVIRWDECYHITQERYDEAPEIHLNEGDVLFTKDGTIGKLLFVDTLPGPASLNSHLLLLRPIDNAFVPKYLYYLLQSKYFLHHVENYKTGTTFYGITQESMGQFKLLASNFDEQTKIATFLDRKTAQIDKLIEIKRQQIELLKEERTAIINQAVTKGLNPDAKMKDSGVEWIGDIPEGWDAKRMKYLCLVQRGQFSHRPRNDPEFYNGEFPFIQTGDVAKADKFVTQYSQSLNEKGYAVSKEFPKGTLVMTIAANIGDVAILGFTACFPDSIVGLIPSPEVDSNYFYYLLWTLKNEFIKSAIENTQLNLNIERIGQHKAVCPPFEEQMKIGQFLDGHRKKFAETISKAEQQIQLLKEYRTTLISDAVTGKIDIREEAA